MRTRRLVTAVAVLATAGASALGGSASGAGGSLPTLNVALNGVRGISVSGSMVSGAVSIVSTFTGKAPTGPQSNGPEFGLVRLNPGATIQQAAGAVQSHHGDANALMPYGKFLVDASAPGTVQAVLTPGNWVALNITGQGRPGFAPFTVTQSSSPAALPHAQNIQTAIDFGFRGPSVLRNGTIVRAQNEGWLVHMVTLNGVRSKAAGMKLIALLQTKASFKKARPYLNGAFANLLGPASNGAMQQMVLNTKPGYYVEACFMDAQDRREHVQLRMERLVRVV
jgi:hypothetical protein